MNVDYDQLLAQLKEKLPLVEDDKTSMTFTSDSDESAFYPAEVDGWILVSRSSRLVPKHFVNTAEYARSAQANEEKDTQSTEA